MTTCKECKGTNENEDGAIVHSLPCQTNHTYRMLLKLFHDIADLSDENFTKHNVQILLSNQRESFVNSTRIQ